MNDRGGSASVGFEGAAARGSVVGGGRAAGSGAAWYRSGVIYEVHVRAFCDSDGDGVGDFRGLTSKLEYLRSLGVTAVWLLPFYPSPLRDDGYDIADYTSVHPSYGTIRDFEAFVAEAHRLGLRVITELVINHTSDRHPWFERARRAPAGSPERDFYVWSDTDEKYSRARIIFKDFERSNWAWDGVAGAYYWHRFYSHQPDLNFANEAVHEAVMGVMDFWFDLGVDGMRLDAVPYLYEREGTNCENLPETHAFLRKLRAHLDGKYEGKMLLAEANQWPEDAAAYFGSGDECHMNFHFPLMPRLFMSLRMEDRFPIVDILEQTPAAPAGCQWALFLRNHDELTLEMVTDEERDYMYRSYASDKRARVNVGIRRRLAPLLDNNRRKIELLHGLLFSLPGTPVLYYGDEIGMGDNYYLGDRDAVRTPMQWSSEGSAGFSEAAEGDLYLPLIGDGRYHYRAVNVESQAETPSSLLWWMRRTLGLRGRHPVFGTGSMRVVRCDNPRVFAFVREDGSERVLVIANLSRFSQRATVDLSGYEGCGMVEMFGGASFGVVSGAGQDFTLGPHGFMWLSLVVSGRGEVVTGEVEGGLEEISTEDDPGTWLTTTAARRWLGAYLSAREERQPWLEHEVRGVRELEMVDALPVPLSEDAGAAAAAVVVVRVRFRGSEFGVFSTVLGLSTAERLAALGVDRSVALASVRHRSHRSERVLYEAIDDPDVSTAVYEMIRERRGARGHGGRLRGEVFEGAGDALTEPGALGVMRAGGRASARASAVALGGRYVLKLIARERPASEAATEVVRHLDGEAAGGVGFGSSPDVYGELVYAEDSGRRLPVALLGSYVEHQSSVREVYIDGLKLFLDEVLTREERGGGAAPAPASRPVIEMPSGGLEAFGEAFARHGEMMARLGERMAELHAALADARGDERFEPERLGTLEARSVYQSMRNTVIPALRRLGEGLDDLSGGVRADAEALLGREDELIGRLRAVAEAPIDSLRIRCYGNLELDHILWTGRDFVFTEFESDPRRRLAETRIRQSALDDVAALLTDMDHTAVVVAQEQAAGGAVPAPSEAVSRLGPWASRWAALTGGALVGGYRSRVLEVGPDLVPSDERGLSVLFDGEMLRRAAWRMHLSLVRRPGEVGLAIGRLGRLLDAPPSSSADGGSGGGEATHPSVG